MSDMSNPRSVPKKHHKLLPLGASVAGGGDDPPPGVFNIYIYIYIYVYIYIYICILLLYLLWANQEEGVVCVIVCLSTAGEPGLGQQNSHYPALKQKDARSTISTINAGAAVRPATTDDPILA